MNKFYIQIIFFLLSVSVYLNNKTFATEPASEENTKTKTKEKTKTIPGKTYSTPEEIYNQNKKLLCTNRNETINAEKFMNEAVVHLAYHATNEDGYELCELSQHYNRTFSRKKHGDTDIQRINCKNYNPYKYNAIINVLWDPALASDFNPDSVERKIVRVYNPNLVMIQQRYKKGSRGHDKYFYALATKAQISEEKTIIVMASTNINDGYPSNEKYKNKIIENANLFKTQINSENDIRNGKLKKIFVNIAGYLIEHKDWYIDITYLESIDGHTPDYNKLFIDVALNKIFRSNEKYDM